MVSTARHPRPTTLARGGSGSQSTGVGDEAPAVLAPALPPLLARLVRVFRVVDAACAVLLLGAVVHAVTTGADVWLPIPAGATTERAVRFLAHRALPAVTPLLTLALLALAVLPAVRPRRLAVAALAVAAGGFLLLACSLSVPWAANQGLGPLALGAALIGVGIAAHVGLAVALWRSTTATA